MNKRQSALLKQLSEYNSQVIVPKKSVNMKDLAALTAKTGVEYAMFTKGAKRLIVRGDANLQIGVKPQNKKSQHNFCGMKMGITNQAGQRGIFANRLKVIVVFS